METSRPYTAADKTRLILAVLFMAMILLLPAVVVPALMGSFSFPGASAGTAQAAARRGRERLEHLAVGSGRS